MNNLFRMTYVTLIIVMLGSAISFGQSGMDPDEVKRINKASDEALEDVKELARQAEKLVAFRQANEKAYGFPSDVQELQKMQNATKSFADDDLEEIVKFYETIQDKYDASGANDLNVAVSKVINPFPAKKTNFPWSANTLEQNIAWFDDFRPELEKALDEAIEQAEETAAEQNKAKQLTDFPADNYSDGNVSDIKEQMLKALLGSVIKSTSEITGIAVISDWVEGKYSDTKQAYRKINGTVLFADTDDDGISRFTSYVFNSNKVDGNWQPLKFKSFCNGCPEGWTKAGSASMGASGDGFLNTLIWFVLALSNILAGLIAGQDIIKKYIPSIEKITSALAPYSIQIGLVALGTGIASFVISFLSLKLLSGIIPQVSAVLLGFILAYDYIKSNAKGKLKDQIDNSQDKIAQVNSYSQTIGLAGLGIGVLYLFLNGSLYFI